MTTHSDDTELAYSARDVRMLLAERDALIRELTDSDECWYDHHGYCQAHGLDPRPCPHERAKALLAAGDGLEPRCSTVVRGIGGPDAPEARCELAEGHEGRHAARFGDLRVHRGGRMAGSATPTGGVNQCP